MLVLGIDPGLAECGMAAVDVNVGVRPRVLVTGTATTKPAGTLHKRVASICEQVADFASGVALCGEYPGVTGAEAWTYQGARSTHQSAVQISRVIERLRCFSERWGVFFYEVNTMTCKSVVGSGRKKPTPALIARLCACPNGPPKNQHEADAVAVALAAARIHKARG